VNPTQGAARSEHRPFTDFFELLHDLRLVWALEIRARLAALESNRRLMGDRPVRILSGGAGEQIRDHISEGETRVELSAA